MYEHHYQLRELPFSIAPDPAYLYMSERHQEALGHLLYGTGQYGGFVQLTGEVGTGKTTIVRTLLEQRLPHVQLVLIHNPRQSELEFLQSLCDGLQIAHEPDRDSLKRLNDLINVFLLRQHAAGKRTVLIIDEAQQLAPEVLEQVRLLTNLETHKEKLLRIMLIGQPELIDLLARRELRQLAQRITARHHLVPLSANETGEYVRHRLQVAGGDRGLFSEAALRAVYRHSGGVPRLVNIICDRALLAGYSRGQRGIDHKLVDLAAGEALGDARPPPARRPTPRWLSAGAAGTVLLALAAGFLLGRGRPSAAREPRPSVAVLHGPERVVDAAPAEVPAPTPPASAAALIAGIGPADFHSRPETALPALAGLWPGGRELRAAAQRGCDALRAQGLACYDGHGPLSALQGLDLPAIVRLREGSRSGYAVLSGIDRDSVRLETAMGPRRLALDEFERRWQDDYRLLWRPGSEELRIGPANRGASVRYLRARLSERLGRAVGESGLDSWDRGLDEALRGFQRQQGLKADGIAGVRTLIALSDRSRAPRLSSPGDP